MAATQYRATYLGLIYRVSVGTIHGRPAARVEQELAMVDDDGREIGRKYERVSKTMYEPTLAAARTRAEAFIDHHGERQYEHWD